MVGQNYFESPFMGIPLKDQVRNPNIIVGDYSYYSGYYHSVPFDECVRYLFPDQNDVDRLIIGKFCSIATGATFIMAGNQGHRLDWISTFPFFYAPEFAEEEKHNGYLPAGDTVIGNDVWIGMEALFLPGVKVGDGAVIAARTQVTKDVAPYTIVGGNPMREIRKRFSDEHIALLLELRWWDWPDEKIRKALPILTSGDFEKLKQFALQKV